MRTIQSEDFLSFLNRGFGKGSELERKSKGDLVSIDLKSKTYNSDDFSIVEINGHFIEDVKIKGMKDFDHLSFHFQFAGHSIAKISNIKNEIPISAGKFNIINCVEPTSDFHFLKQPEYKYICVGIKQDKLAMILDEVPQLSYLSMSLTKNEPFNLFNNPKAISHRVMSTLNEMTSKFVPSGLQGSYYETKAMEAILLSVSDLTGNLITSKLNRQEEKNIYDLKYLLDSHPNEQFSIQYLCSKFGFNKNKIQTAFKEKFGKTIFDYWIEKEMNIAYQKLMETNLPITQIAYQQGYSEVSAFSRAFKKRFGKSPKEARGL